MPNNQGNYTFRPSPRIAKRIQEELNKQDVTPTELIRSIVVEYLDHEEVTNSLHSELERQLSGMFKLIHEEQLKFREEIREELKENRIKINRGVEGLEQIIRKYTTLVEVLENNAKLTVRKAPHESVQHK